MIQQLAVEIVRAILARAGRDDFRAQLVLPDERSGPVALFATPHRAPNLLAGLRIERHEERLLFIIVHDVKPPVVKHRRRRKSPAIARLHRRPFLFPKLLASHVIAEQTVIAKIRIHAFAVGNGRLGGIAVLDVNTPARLARERRAFPQHLARPEVKAKHLPMMHPCRWLITVAAKVQPLLRHPLFAVSRDGRHKHTLAPHHRRGPAAPGQIPCPLDILGGTPFIGQICIRRDPHCPRPAKLRPVVRGTQGHAEGDCSD